MHPESSPATTPALLTPPSTLSRYYSLHVGRGHARRAASCLPASAPAPAGCEDTVVARHHNGVCVLCLSPRHMACRSGVTRVEFRDGALRAVQGKRKRGGTFLEGGSKLAMVECADGARYEVRATVRGVLVEANARLQCDPMLAGTAPLTEGFLAVLLPRPAERHCAVDALEAVQNGGEFSW